MIFVQSIHVRIMVNVSLKATVDVVFVHRPTMVMIVEKVTGESTVPLSILSFLLLQCNEPIHVKMFTVAMDNVGMVFVNVILVTPEHDAIFHVDSIDAFIEHASRSLLSSLLFIADACAGVNCNYGTCIEGRCTCSEGYTGPYCDTISKMKEIDRTIDQSSWYWISSCCASTSSKCTDNTA